MTSLQKQNRPTTEKKVEQKHKLIWLLYPCLVVVTVLRRIEVYRQSTSMTWHEQIPPRRKDGVSGHHELSCTGVNHLGSDITAYQNDSFVSRQERAIFTFN
ncbi:MAG: hypothetical protein CMM01_23365 [Rhodopirellula sp.]|jgi:hypothetical protein|nr:hypothetical protein [Rhodopirellula sp.]